LEIIKLGKYVSLVPTHYAAVRQQFRNFWLWRWLNQPWL